MVRASPTRAVSDVMVADPSKSPRSARRRPAPRTPGSGAGDPHLHQGNARSRDRHRSCRPSTCCRPGQRTRLHGATGRSKRPIWSPATGRGNSPPSSSSSPRDERLTAASSMSVRWLQGRRGERRGSVTVGPADRPDPRITIRNPLVLGDRRTNKPTPSWRSTKSAGMLGLADLSFGPSDGPAGCSTTPNGDANLVNTRSRSQFILAVLGGTPVTQNRRATSKDAGQRVGPDVSDTEEVGGSNPPPPTEGHTGQRPNPASGNSRDGQSCYLIPPYHEDNWWDLATLLKPRRSRGDRAAARAAHP